MCSCHAVFTDQFILRIVLARILNIFQIPQTSQQRLVLLFDILYFECADRHGGDSVFAGESAQKCV